MSVTACGWAHRDLPRALVESTPCTAHTAGAEPARARQCVGDVTVVSGARDTVHTPTETGPRAFPAASEQTPPSAPPMGLCTPEAERRRAFKHVLNSLYDFTVSRVSASEPQSQPASQERACPCLVNQSHATFLTCKNRECEKLRRQCAHDTASGGHAAQRARARQDPWSPDRERDGRGRLLRPQLQECTRTHARTHAERGNWARRAPTTSTITTPDATHSGEAAGPVGGVHHARCGASQPTFLTELVCLLALLPDLLSECVRVVGTGPGC